MSLVTYLQAQNDTLTTEGAKPLVRDADLLNRFLKERDDAAFSAMVERYGAMVFAIALRIVRDRHSAEDVTQAVFLILARDAKRIRRSASLSCWLHGVTLRVSKKAIKRRSREQVSDAVNELEAAADSFAEIHSIHEQQVLDEELAQLSDLYREPLILHFLQGKSYQETADTLGVTVGAIEGRLKRGKRELQLRLTKRGIGLGAALAALSWSHEVAAGVVQEELCKTITIHSITAFQGTAFSPTCSPEAVFLSGKEATMFSMTKIFVMAGGLFLAASTGWLGHAGFGGTDSDGAGDTGLANIETAVTASVSQQSSASTILLAEGNPPVDDVFDNEDPFGSSDAITASQKNLDKLITVERNTSPAVEKIEEALDKVGVQFEFAGNPLSDVVDYTSEMLQIPILIDGIRLAEEGRSGDDEVKFVMNSDLITTRDALNLMIEDLGLTYIIKDGVLVITTRIFADEYLETRVYDVRPMNLSEPDGLADVIIHSTGDGTSWSELGGLGEITWLDGSFVIRTSQKTHREIEVLLNQLARLAATNDDNPSWPRSIRLHGGGSSGGFGGGDGGLGSGS